MVNKLLKIQMLVTKRTKISLAAGQINPEIVLTKEAL
jgi:hypothetical protein